MLTVTNGREGDIPILSAKELEKAAYPRFKVLLEASLATDVTDFWIIEHGSLTRRVHMNVFLAADAHITQELVEANWRRVAESATWQDEFKAWLPIEYWIKELTSTEANVFAYGGSVVFISTDSTRRRPLRKRRSDYTRAHTRRYRPQCGERFAVRPECFI